MDDISELKKYETMGKALEEMMNPSEEVSESEEEPNFLGKKLTKVLGEALLKEMGPYDANPYRDCPRKVKRAQKLINLISRSLNDYMNLFYRSTAEEDDDSDLNDMIEGSLKLVIGAAISKLQTVWNEKEDPKEISADPNKGGIEIEIVPQEEIKSPTGEVYTVNEITDSDVKLTNKISNTQFTIKSEILKKWKLNS